MSKSHKNKAIFYVVILILLVGLGLFLKQKKAIAPLVTENPTSQTQENTSPVSIGSKTIKEENFTGTVSTVSGKSILAAKSQAYIDQEVNDFRKQANNDVPPMRQKFGADSPTAQYEIDIEAKYVKSEKTESVSILTYTYTGGAHGNSSYKVITTTLVSGKILSLSDVIKKGKESAFTTYVKKALNDWRPEGSDGSPVFPEDVQALTFNSFANWSLDNTNLIIYFSQYDIGPGVLGPVAFPLPIEKIKDFLQ
ncbi:MAG: DUF3298 domain-containing protein [Patescibacteria group bacterium]|nr:DUF3298 domain-containing protein [Patescibacteria group bacterium]